MICLEVFFFTNFWNFLLLFSPPNEESIATSEFKFLEEQLNCSNFFLILILTVERDVYM